MFDAAMRTLEPDEIHLWWLPWQHGDDRSALRRVLATYLGGGAEDVDFSTGAHGKPHLVGSSQRLHFNWSHCTDIAVVAIALDIELGVDIERRDRRTRSLDIAKRWFAPSELAVLASLQGVERMRAFASIWTVKEAVLKALGQGLSFGLGQVVVGLRADGVPTLRRVADEDAANTRWQLAHPAAPMPGIASALAWQGPERDLCSFDLVHATGDCATQATGVLNRSGRSIPT